MSEWKSTFRVGVYKVKMTYRHGDLLGISTEWEPHLPARLSKEEWKQYRAGREALFAEVAKALGGPVLVLEC
jgi:hypothetical protein